MSQAGSYNTKSSAPDFAHAFHAIDDPCVFINRVGALQATNTAFDTIFCDDTRGVDNLNDLFADPLDAHVIPWNSGKTVKQTLSYIVLDKRGAPLQAQLKFVPQSKDLFLIIFKIKTANQSALEQAHAQLNLTFTQNLTSAIGFNLAMQSVHVSGFITQLFGLGHDKGELSLEDWLDLVHPDDREQATRCLECDSRQIFDETNFTVRVRYFGPEKYLWMRHHLQVTECDERDRAQQLTGQVYDVSETVQIEENARLAELSRDQAVEIAELTQWSFDFTTGDSHIEGSLSKLFDTHSGFGPASWRGRVHPDDYSSLNAAFFAAEFGRNIDHSFRIKDHDDGWVHLRLIGTLVSRLNDGNKRVSGFIRQIDKPSDNAIDAVDRNANTTVELSAWSGDLTTQEFVIVGPLLQRLGVEACEFRISFDDWFERVHPEDHKTLKASIHDIFNKNVAVNEYRIKSLTGEYVWVTGRGAVSQQTADGTPIKVSGVLGEMTSPKIVDSVLARHERQLANAVDSALLGIWHLPREGGVQTLRGKVLEWLGRSRDDDLVPNSEMNKWFHRDDHALIKEHAQALFAGETKSVRFKSRLKSPDGWRWIQIIGGPAEFDVDGRPNVLAGIYLDVSEEADNALRVESEMSKLESIYENTPALMYSTDATAHIIMVSDHWLKRMGYEREEVLGKHITEFLTPEFNSDDNRARFKRSIQDRCVSDRAMTAVTRSGEQIDVILSANWIFDDDGNPIHTHTIWNEVTALNQAKRDLEMHARQVERVNQELNRFTTIASHDLQEPLRKIAAFSSLLLSRHKGALDEESDRSLQYLVDASKRMQTMISDLLDYSQTAHRTLQRGAVDLNTSVEQVINDLAPVIEEADAKLHVSNLPTVHADTVLMRMVITNLISNAIKYQSRQRPVCIEITAQCHDDMARVCVSDNGIGIDREHSEDIFTPFVRLHGVNEYEGTGIGLGICRQGIERLGGKIWVDSQLDQGSKFYFELPLSTGELSIKTDDSDAA